LPWASLGRKVIFLRVGIDLIFLLLPLGKCGHIRLYSKSSHPKSGGSIWASVSVLFLNSWRMSSHIVRYETDARILKAHSHLHWMSGSSIWASLECHCCFWIAGGLISVVQHLRPHKKNSWLASPPAHKKAPLRIFLNFLF
jgi:hypothetical protein